MWFTFGRDIECNCNTIKAVIFLLVLLTLQKAGTSLVAVVTLEGWLWKREVPKNGRDTERTFECKSQQEGKKAHKATKLSDSFLDWSPNLLAGFMRTGLVSVSADAGSLPPSNFSSHWWKVLCIVSFSSWLVRHKHKSMNEIDEVFNILGKFQVFLLPSNNREKLFFLTLLLQQLKL